MKNSSSPLAVARRRFLSDRTALIGTIGIITLSAIAVFAPFIANGRPLLMISDDGVWSMPFLHFIFAPDSSEVLVEKIFNFFALFLPILLFWHLILKRHRKCFKAAVLIFGILTASAFVFSAREMDRKNYREIAKNCRFALFAPIPFGPDEIVGEPCASPDQEHILGCDDIGRDLASRLISGSRVSLAVGILATLISLATGLIVGMSTGFFRGKFDLAVMRLVEILLCFPTFLLLLILMSMLGDYKIGESIPLVILVIGFTGWMNLAFLVRGEVLKESSLPYIQSCIVSGIPARQIMFRHLLPNISAPVLISFTFGIAGAIIGESGLSFLGFGVQPPTASWGNLLRQAFDNPLAYWHLTFFPGAALFIAVLSFNFTGEGLRRAFDVKEI